jgi:hypothetical protein
VICPSVNSVVPSIAAIPQHTSDFPPKARPQLARLSLVGQADPTTQPRILRQVQGGNSGNGAAPQSSDQAHTPLRQPRRQSVIAEQQPALAETRRRWTVARVNHRPEPLLRNAERTGDLGDCEVSGHCNGRRWHRGADLPGDPVPAPDALQELPNGESEGEPGHQTN